MRVSISKSSSSVPKPPRNAMKAHESFRKIYLRMKKYVKSNARSR
jgi:hypothetical protein